MINVVQFQGGDWSFINFRGVIDKTYIFRGVIAYLLNWKESKARKYDNVLS